MSATDQTDEPFPILPDVRWFHIATWLHGYLWGNPSTEEAVFSASAETKGYTPDELRHAAKWLGVEIMTEGGVTTWEYSGE
jgi:hypothetical protein